MHKQLIQKACTLTLIICALVADQDYVKSRRLRIFGKMPRLLAGKEVLVLWDFNCVVLATIDHWHSLTRSGPGPCHRELRDMATIWEAVGPLTSYSYSLDPWPWNGTAGGCLLLSELLWFLDIWVHLILPEYLLDVSFSPGSPELLHQAAGILHDTKVLKRMIKGLGFQGDDIQSL